MNIGNSRSGLRRDPASGALRLRTGAAVPLSLNQQRAVDTVERCARYTGLAAMPKAHADPAALTDPDGRPDAEAG